MSDQLISAKEARSVAMMQQEKQNNITKLACDKIIKDLIPKANGVIKNAMHFGKTTTKVEVSIITSVQPPHKDLQCAITAHFKDYGYELYGFQFSDEACSLVLTFTLDW